MKVIFLDIDGVLNRFVPAELPHDINRECVEHLNHILRNTEAKLVLSSSWRYVIHNRNMTLHGFEFLLRTHGLLPGRLVGLTRPDEDTPDDLRGQQIRDWLDENGPVEDYLILDDYSEREMVPVAHRLLQTRPDTGLTESDAYRAIEMLNR